MKLAKFLVTAFAVFNFLILQSQNIPQYNIILGNPASNQGYYLIHAFKTGANSSFSSLILDRFGRTVYYKKFNSVANDFKIQTNGMISYSSAVNPANTKFILIDSTFFIKDSVKCVNGIFTDAHDMLVLPDGHYLLLGYENVVMDLSSYHWFNGNNSPGSTTANVKCAVIQELDQNKNLVFSWRAFEHYLFADVQEQFLFSPVNVDWTHSNALTLDNDGNILLSNRHFSEITKINRQNGIIIWRLGGKNNQFTFISDPYSGFSGQHDIRRLPNGNITLFDNGWKNSPQHPARAIEYSLDEQNHSAALVWSHSYNSSSSQFLGSVGRLSNGNTVIGWGGLLNSNVVFNCVKPDGSLILEINFPDSSLTYRAFSYLTLPWKLNRPILSCRFENGNYFLDAPAGYSSYKWSTGDTTMSLHITQPDTFYVFVPYGSGGYISSERYVITSIQNVCEVVGNQNHPSNQIPQSYNLYQNYPNPFNPSTRIKFDITADGKRQKSNVKLIIYNILGKETEVIVNEQLSPGTYEISWNASNFPSGVYFLKIIAKDSYGESGSFISTKKMLLIK